MQGDSSTPDGQAGIRFSVDSWTGAQTTGPTGSQLSPFSIAVTGLLRHVAVDQFSAAPKTTNDLTMDAIAVDGFVPVIPASKKSKDNALSRSRARSPRATACPTSTRAGRRGVSFPALPNPMAVNPAPAYAADIDNGIVTYDLPKGGLHGIQWDDVPPRGAVLPAHLERQGLGLRQLFALELGQYALLRLGSQAPPCRGLVDVELLVDPLPAVRIGAEFAVDFIDVYVDGQHAA